MFIGFTKLHKTAALKVLLYYKAHMHPVWQNTLETFRMTLSFMCWISTLSLVTIVTVCGKTSEIVLLSIKRLLSSDANKKYYINHIDRRMTGLYTNTLWKIICRDLTRFIIVFAVVFFAFCGALFLSLKATDSQELFR